MACERGQGPFKEWRKQRFVIKMASLHLMWTTHVMKLKTESEIATADFGNFTNSDLHSVNHTPQIASFSPSFCAAANMHTHMYCSFWLHLGLKNGLMLTCVR